MAPYTLKWGILATGGIATTFSKDLMLDPAVRGVTDVQHKIVAAASSSSKDRAAAFLKDVGAGADAVAYGSYAELVVDPNVDIIYVATPHSHHFQNAMLAIELGGKPVLCEKAFTVTSAQAKKLVAAARAKNLFLMEAVWTRYFPLSIKIRELVASGAIGEVTRVISDLSVNASTDSPDGTLEFPDSNRMVNLDLAGGAMLDLGVYAFTWLFQILYHLQPESNESKEAPIVTAAVNKYARTGADENTTAILSFPKHRSMGIGMAGLRVASGVALEKPAGPSILIQGSKGEIQVQGPAFRPQQFTVVKLDGSGGTTSEVVDVPIPTDTRAGVKWPGHGMFWEADECARCLRDGKKESSTLPLSESIVIMESMEAVLKQGDIQYPEVITSDVYSKDSPQNTGKK